MHWDVSIEVNGDSCVHLQSIERNGAHLQGVQTDVHQLTESVVVRVSWLEEDGVLDVSRTFFCTVDANGAPSMSRCGIRKDI